MGCTSAKTGKPDDMISNRSIDHEGDNPVYHHGIGCNACGYGFNFDSKEVQDIMGAHALIQKREEQMDNFQKFEEKYLCLKQHYKEHDIDSCISLLPECSRLLRNIDFQYIEMGRGEKKQIEAFLNNIQEEHDDLNTFVKYFEDGWEDQGEDEGVKIFTRREEGTIGALMIRKIDLPVQIFLIVLSEMDFYTELIPDVKESKEDKYIARNHKVGYVLYDVPFISYRQAFFEGVGYNRLNHNNTIFMYSRSVNNNPSLCKKLDYQPKLNQKYIQIEYKYMMVRYVPEGVNKGEISIAVNIDMKLSFVPLWIMEKVVRKFCFDFFKVVMKAVSSFKGSKWDQKVQKHPQTFLFFRDIIQQYYKKKGYTQ